MAEVSANVEAHEEEEDDDEEYIETLDSIAHWCNNNAFDDDDLYASDSDPFSSHVSYFMPSSDHSFRSPIDLAGDDSNSDSIIDANRSCVMDDHDSESETMDDLNFRVFEGGDEIGSNYVEELGLGLGFGVGLDQRASVSESGESSTIREAEQPTSGLRVVGMGSDSDSEEVDGMDRVVDSDLPFCWDCLRIDDQRTSNEDFEWEEVADDSEVLSTVFARIEDISLSSESSEEDPGNDVDEGGRNLDWEVLLAVNNLERNLDIEGDTDADADADADSYLTVQDDYMYAAEYDTLFGQFAENESALKGSPPAAKSVVENLPLVALRHEDLQESNVICAVCKDEILLEEKVKRLPCCHYYHVDCIVPWLSIRNSCPVCRYELPTDDPDYERRKTQRGGGGGGGGGGGLSQDLQFYQELNCTCCEQGHLRNRCLTVPSCKHTGQIAIPIYDFDIS